MPAGTNRDEKGFAVGGLVFEKLLQERSVRDVGEISLAEKLTLAVEFVREALQKEHAEDEFLELRGIHLATQDVGGLEEEAFELGESNFFSAQHFFLALYVFLLERRSGPGGRSRGRSWRGFRLYYISFAASVLLVPQV